MAMARTGFGLFGLKRCRQKRHSIVSESEDIFDQRNTHAHGLYLFIPGRSESTVRLGDTDIGLSQAIAFVLFLKYIRCDTQNQTNEPASIANNIIPFHSHS